MGTQGVAIAAAAVGVTAAGAFALSRMGLDGADDTATRDSTYDAPDGALFSDGFDSDGKEIVASLGSGVLGGTFGALIGWNVGRLVQGRSGVWAAAFGALGAAGAVIGTALAATRDDVSKLEVPSADLVVRVGYPRGWALSDVGERARASKHFGQSPVVSPDFASIEQARTWLSTHRLVNAVDDAAAIVREGDHYELRALDKTMYRAVDDWNDDGKIDGVMAPADSNVVAIASTRHRTPSIYEVERASTDARGVLEEQA